MSMLEPLCSLIGINPNKNSRKEIFILEAELFSNICRELKEFFRDQNKEYFCLMKFNTEMEEDMLESKFVRLIIEDILSTEQYNIKGIACYTNTHEDVVNEVFIGCNTNPSGIFLQRIIELHRSVRRDLYSTIIKRFLKKY